VDPASAARLFQSFGRDAAGTDSPLYAQVCEVIAESPELVELSTRSREQTPMVFLAAIHDELLRDPGAALAAYYPTVGGDWPRPGLAQALTDFCAERAERLQSTLAMRRTQTNETARCAGLLPTFAAVGDGRPLALIEVGASAGLNLNWDRYAYDYGGTPAGAPSSPLTIACELHGPRVPPLVPPPVSTRVGVDLSPLDASDHADARWLHACLWPDQPARHARLEAALDIAREHPVEVRRGDALEELPGLIAEPPEDTLVCVFHTAAVAYFGDERVQELTALLEAVEREIVWVSGEASSILGGGPVAEGAPLHFALMAGRPGALVERGRMGHHGGWLEWLG
jgi:hypothetical protein